MKTGSTSADTEDGQGHAPRNMHLQMLSHAGAWHFPGPCGEPGLFRVLLVNNGKFTHAHSKDGKAEDPGYTDDFLGMTVSVLGSLGTAWCASASVRPTVSVAARHGGHQSQSGPASAPRAEQQYTHD